MNRRNTLPGLPPVILLVLYAGLLITPLLIAGVTDGLPFSPWLELGAATGLVAIVGLAIQFVTSGRFELLSGRLGIDVTMAFHKWSARVILTLVLLHPLVFIAPSLLHDPVGALMRLWVMLTMPQYLTGVIGLIALGLLIAFSIHRHYARYEAWRGLHGVLALAVMALILHHTWTTGTYASSTAFRFFLAVIGGLVIVNAVYMYILRRQSLQRTPWVVDSVRRVANRLWEVTLTGQEGSSFHYTAGQFVWLSVSPQLVPLYDHPFSLASTPKQGLPLRLLIKEAGDFTSTIGELTPGTRVGIDGPHGSFVLRDHTAECVLLIAGGVGIAPVLGLLRDLAASQDKRDIVLIYACKCRENMIDPNELKNDAEGLNITFSFLLETAPEDWPYQTGTVDDKVLRDALGSTPPLDAVAMICGPGGMTAHVADMLHGLGVPLQAIHYERFDYHEGHQSRRDRQQNRIFWLMGGAVLVAMALFAIR